jgi:uncharacterized cupin superfamily protein
MDELFYVLDGAGEYRWGEERLAIKSGDLIAAPAGTKPHQLINTGKDELRYLGVSSIAATEVVDYPDSKKVGIIAGTKGGELHTATYRGLGRMQPADYFDGEND